MSAGPRHHAIVKLSRVATGKSREKAIRGSPAASGLHPGHVGAGPSTRRGQLGVDDLLELLDGPRPEEEAAVDEEGGGARDPDARAVLDGRLDELVVARRLEAALELPAVQAQRGGADLEVLVAEVAGRVEQP